MDSSSSREPAGERDSTKVGVSGANTNQANQGAVAATRTIESSDPRIAALRASVVHDDLSANNSPPRATNTIQGHYGPIPAANPTVPAVECKSCQLQRGFGQQTNVSIATEPAPVGLDDVITYEEEVDQHADAEKSNEVAVSDASDHHSHVPSIEWRCSDGRQRSEQPTNPSAADKIVEADHPTSLEQESVTDQGAMDLEDTVASAQSSSNLHQDSIIANIEGKLLWSHRNVKHKLTPRLQE
jgi:hypothetical protein